MTPDRFAIFASTSDDYFAGTCVALASFMEFNPWYKGDIVIATHDLSDDRQQFLVDSFDNLIIQSIEPRLYKAAWVLAEEFSYAPYKARIFYNLQAFLLEGYDRILKIDTDMLFRGDIKELFQLTSVIAGSPARPFYKNMSRSAKDLSLVTADHHDAIEFWMNAGLYSIDGKSSSAEFEKLIAYLNVDFWRTNQSRHTDQVVINLHFNGSIESLSPRYNYLVPDESGIRSHSGVAMKDALVWHFNDHHKPWLLNKLPRELQRTPAMASASSKWLECYTRFMQKRYLHSSMALRKANNPAVTEH